MVPYSSSKLAEIRSRRLYRGPDWDAVKAKILLRDKVCVKCGKPAECVHHVVPWALTCDNGQLNLVALCFKCHGSEHNYMKRLKKPSPAVRIYLKKLMGYCPASPDKWHRWILGSAFCVYCALPAPGEKP